MSNDKNSRTVTLQCTRCGSSEFQHDAESERGPIECVSCGRVMTREELLSENSSNIDAPLNKFKKTVVKDVEIMLAKAFGGTKHINLKIRL